MVNLLKHPLILHLVFFLLIGKSVNIALENTKSLKDNNDTEIIEEINEEEIVKFSGKKLSRSKRALGFPLGSMFLITFCNTNIMIRKPPPIVTVGSHFGVIFPLPNNTFIKNKWYLRKHKRRRHRREVYERIETILNTLGFDGKSCVFRALCEMGSYLQAKRQSDSVVVEILKIIFDFPDGNFDSSSVYRSKEANEHKFYSKAHSNGFELEVEGCSTLYPLCPFSLLDAALGYYSDYGSNKFNIKDDPRRQLSEMNELNQLMNLFNK